MILKDSQLASTCLGCLLRLSRRTRAFPPLHQTAFGRRSPRRYASDSSPQTKERIEALISGASVDLETYPRDGIAAKPISHPRGRGSIDRGEALSDWGLKPSENADAARHFPVGPRAPNEHHSNEDPAAGDDPAAESETNARPKPKMFRHELINRHSLGLDALGKPVEAIMIKNPNKMRRPKKASPASVSVSVWEQEPATAGTPIELQSVLPVPTAASDFSDEVWRNMEEIMPKDGTVVARRDFESLARRLKDGFTQDQLKTYLNRQSRIDAGKAESNPAYPWIVKQTPWVSAGPNVRRKTNKGEHAAMILTSKWKLEIQDQVEGLGSAAVWLTPDSCQAIARSSRDIIQNLQTEFLDKANKEGIGMDEDECRLTINSRKATFFTILSRLDGVIRTMQSRTIAVHHVAAEHLKASVLETLGRLTATALQCDLERNELCVSWLPDANLSTDGTEDPADIVGRLLRGNRATGERAVVCVGPREMTQGSLNEKKGTAKQASQQAKTTISKRKAKSLDKASPTEPKPTNITKQREAKSLNKGSSEKSRPDLGFFLTHQRDKRNMSWRDKLREWHRYVWSISKAVENKEPDQAFLPTLVKLPEPASISPDETVEIVATFGHVLHLEAKRSKALAGETRRLLCPVIPHPAALTDVADAMADAAVPSVQKTAIVLNFQPSPNTAEEPSLTSKLPQVRLHMPFNPLADLSNISFPDSSTLEAIQTVRQIDCLYPGHSVDVNIHHQRRFSLDTALQSALPEFLRASDFNLRSGRLRTPSKTSFAIPSKLMLVELRNSNIPVGYTFMGLEIHQTIDMEWRNRTLRYSSIEAGHHGGQQQTLSLIAGAHLPLADTLSLIEQIVRDEHFSWTQGHTLVKERSTEQFARDMMDNDYVPSGPDDADEPFLLNGEEDGSDSVHETGHIEPGDLGHVHHRDARDLHLKRRHVTEPKHKSDIS